MNQIWKINFIANAALGWQSLESVHSSGHKHTRHWML